MLYKILFIYAYLIRISKRKKKENVYFLAIIRDIFYFYHFLPEFSFSDFSKISDFIIFLNCLL